MANTDFDYEQKIAGCMHYKDDVRHTFNNRAPMGPSYNNEMIWPVYAEYDEDADMTTCHFSKMPPAELMQQYLQQQQNGDQ